MNARTKLREAIGGVVGKVSGIPTDEADRCGPPSFVFRSPYVRGYRFEGRPLSRPPEEKWVGILYRATPSGEYQQAGIGMFRDGRFTNDKGKPLEGELYWTAMVDE